MRHPSSPNYSIPGIYGGDIAEISRLLRKRMNQEQELEELRLYAEPPELPCPELDSAKSPSIIVIDLS